MENFESFYDLPFSEIIRRAGSRNPSPGGGAASAMAGVLGASMASMVANVSMGKPRLEGFRLEHEALLDRVWKGVGSLKALTVRDMEAYQGLLAARRLPQGTAEQKAAREGEVELCLIEATLAPLEIAVAADGLLAAVLRLGEICAECVLSDVSVAAMLLEAAVRSAAKSVEVNLPGIDDRRLRDDLEARKNRLLHDSLKSLGNTLSIVSGRIKAV
jgi:formiminotetrahydrofolate cyclodeaminase